MENVVNQRLNNLDVVKAICAFLVICIHISYKENLGNIITPLCRIAVPLFFMITGYFYHKTSKKPLKQIKKVIILTILANLLYFILGIIINGSADVPNKEEIIDSLIYNSSPFSFQLWYLNALLYVLIIVYFADKIHIRKYLYFLIPILIGTNIIFGEYSIAILDKDLDPIYMRNFLFTGLPYFFFFFLLYQHKDKLIKIFTSKRLLILIPIFALTTVLEEHILTSAKMDSIGEIYISTTFFAIAVFLLAVQVKQVSTQNVLSVIGRKYSTYIYVIHVFFINLFNKYVTNSNDILNNTIQIIIFFASLLVAIVYTKLKKEVLGGWKKYNKITNSVKLLYSRRESE